MTYFAALFGLAAAIRMTIASAPSIAKLLRGWLTAKEVVALTQIAGILLMIVVLLFAQLSSELPAALFIYGRF